LTGEFKARHGEGDSSIRWELSPLSQPNFPQANAPQANAPQGGKSSSARSQAANAANPQSTASNSQASSTGQGQFSGLDGLDYYQVLGVSPDVSLQGLRQAHRDLSKLYHPDTTRFPGAIARLKFEQVQQAYEALSDPARRFQHDLSRGIVRPPQPSYRNPPARPPSPSSSIYLDAEERPLSSGELFALFILGLTFLGCLVLALSLGIARGEAWMPLPSWQSQEAASTLAKAAADLAQKLASLHPAKIAAVGAL
jgi:hypothetical protein